MHPPALLPTHGSSGRPGSSPGENHHPLLLVSGATRTIRSLGNHPRLGRLTQPRAYNQIDELARCGLPWAADNDALAGLDPDAYLHMLNQIAATDRSRLLFVTVPDAVEMTPTGPRGDWAGTLWLWRAWRKAIQARQLPAAIVAQDGATADSVPWSEIRALFLGGSDAYKDGPDAAVLMREARARGVWVHVGRINTLRRYWRLHGLFDSYDGTGFSRWSKRIAWMLDSTSQQRISDLDT